MLTSSRWGKNEFGTKSGILGGGSAPARSIRPPGEVIRGIFGFIRPPPTFPIRAVIACRGGAERGGAPH